jgi:phage terminase large subunit GpA-like protein
MPGLTDCTSGNLRINREVSAAYSSNVGRDMSAVRACNDQGNTAHVCHFVTRHSLLFFLWFV